MLINSGNASDPWTAGRHLSAQPEIDPTAVVRDSTFGRYTYLGPRSMVFSSELGDYGYAIGDNQIAHAIIGKFCNIATGVRINPSNHPWWRATLHHFTYRSASYGFHLPDDTEIFDWRRDDNVTIGPDVWIGHNAIIMPGVTIGIGAAIGSGAVVTKDVPPFAVVAGVPATVLRLRFETSTIEGLMRIAWWDWSHDALDAAVADFRALDARTFVEKYDHRNSCQSGRSPLDPCTQRDFVRNRYAAIAKGGHFSPPAASACCGNMCAPSAAEMAERMGYTAGELATAVEGSNLGLGCGNPIALAALLPGQTVADLGSGAGFDCFLAAAKVGDSGRVIGIDMTPEMVAKARRNAAAAGHANVEFRLGEIENLPLADNSVDVVISNCVINLSPDKPAVFREAYRVMRRGGWLALSDVVAMRPLPAALAADPDMLCGCAAGAAQSEDVKAWLSAAGFVDIAIEVDPASRDVIREWAPGRNVEDYLASARITARKP